MSAITLPYGFVPRPYQRDFFAAMDGGLRRAIRVWPRRAGKDLTDWQYLIMSAMRRKGSYFHVMPYATDSRKNIWEGMTHEGKGFLDYIPKEIMAKPPNNTQMRIEFKNGSILRMASSENFDSLRGGNPLGYVFSEWGTSNPGAKNVVQPIVKANEGFMVFNGNSNGMNHYYNDYMQLKDNPRWYVDYKTALTLVDENGNRYITDKILDEEREDGMAESVIQREYFNNWGANSAEFILLAKLSKMREDGRLGNFAYNPDLPVVTAWDIGVHDDTAIWFAQIENGWVTLIDFYANNGAEHQIDHYVKYVLEKPYVYKAHYFPHDINVTEWGGGSRVERAERLGVVPARLGPNGRPGVPKLGLWDGIDIMRSMLDYSYLNSAKAQEGFDCLLGYKRGWDKTRQQATNLPMKNFAIHGADALRTLAVGLNAENLIARGRDKDGRKKRGRADAYGHDKRTLRTKKNWKSA